MARRPSSLSLQLCPQLCSPPGERHPDRPRAPDHLEQAPERGRDGVGLRGPEQGEVRPGLLGVVEGGQRVIEVHAQADQLGHARPRPQPLVAQALGQLLPCPVRRLEGADGQPGHQRREDPVELLEVVQAAPDEAPLDVLPGQVSAEKSEVAGFEHDAVAEGVHALGHPGCGQRARALRPQGDLQVLHHGLGEGGQRVALQRLGESALDVLGGVSVAGVNAPVPECLAACKTQGEAGESGEGRGAGQASADRTAAQRHARVSASLQPDQTLTLLCHTLAPSQSLVSYAPCTYLHTHLVLISKNFNH